MNEKLIERKIVKHVKKLGGLPIKLFSAWFTGLPDRLVLLPGARIWFAEIKTTGKNLTVRQKIVMGVLQKLGFSVDVIDDELTLQNFLNKLES
jgi:hypothetical protein